MVFSLLGMFFSSKNKKKRRKKQNFKKFKTKFPLLSRLPVYNWSHLPKISKAFLLPQNNSPLKKKKKVGVGGYFLFGWGFMYKNQTTAKKSFHPASSVACAFVQTRPVNGIILHSGRLTGENLHQLKPDALIQRLSSLIVCENLPGGLLKHRELGPNPRASGQ